MKYNVFCDFHHAGLLDSMILLFEKRLGGKVFRPIGMEWAEKGFWKVYDHPATQAQYLGFGSATPDGTDPLNDVLISTPKEPQIYYCHDIDSGQLNRAITFEGFMQIPIDIVIATLPQHIDPFLKLCELHPSKPKFIYQMGNNWDFPMTRPVKNVMASRRLPYHAEGVNVIQYHQEFDIHVFKPDFKIYPRANIFSFINVFSGLELFATDWQLFQTIEAMTPDFTFRSYGGQCRDGAAHGIHELSQKMRQARFIWHTKQGGDGYGHVLFNTAAIGRPTLVKKSYYDGKLGEALLIDGETCINIDGLNPSEIVDKIKYYSDPDRYFTLCTNIVENFKKHVDFDKEAEAFTTFLQKLQ